MTQPTATDSAAPNGEEKMGRERSERFSEQARSEAFIGRGMMRVRGVHDLTGMSSAEIYRLCHAGTFRFRRLPGGRGMLIYRASVEEFMREGLPSNALYELRGVT